MTAPTLRPTRPVQGLKKRPETEGEDSDSDEETSYDDNQCIGVSRGGRSTKIHAAVDALGNPVRIILSCGNTNDITMAQMLLDGIGAGTTVLADKAYCAEWLRKYIEAQNADWCIPPKSSMKEPWDCDYFRYKERHVVENFFLKIKEFRRVAMRFDKLTKRFYGFVVLAAVHVLLA